MRGEIKENIKIYEDIIEKLCNLYRKIEIDKRPLAIYETFRYMILNNYLSSEKFTENIPNTFKNMELYGYLPMDVTGSMVMANYGVCRHETDFLSHIYLNFSYESSQVFVYFPDIQIKVYNNGNHFLTNYHAQEYIDDAIKELDLFSQEKISLYKKYKNIEVHIEYLPSKPLLNHTINIVKENSEKIIHILDIKIS